MHWDVTWKYPLLLDDDNCVVAKDNFPCVSGVVSISGHLTMAEFIAKAEAWWKKLGESLD